MKLYAFKKSSTLYGSKPGVCPLSASGGQRNRKGLKANTSNGSERAEQEKYQFEIVFCIWKRIIEKIIVSLCFYKNKVYATGI